MPLVELLTGGWRFPNSWYTVEQNDQAPACLYQPDTLTWLQFWSLPFPLTRSSCLSGILTSLLFSVDVVARGPLVWVLTRALTILLWSSSMTRSRKPSKLLPLSSSLMSSTKSMSKGSWYPFSTRFPYCMKSTYRIFCWAARSHKAEPEATLTDLDLRKADLVDFCQFQCCGKDLSCSWNRTSI